MEGDELRAWRRARRGELLAARGALPPAEREAATAAIVAQLEALLLSGGGSVGLYWPIRHEVDLRPLAARLRADARLVALPAIVAAGEPLAFRAWHDDEQLVNGPYALRQPPDGEPLVPETLAIPLVGFDDAGYRLGYGAGDYDRTLAALRPLPYTIGIGFELAHLATIHPQPHDVPLDAVITETGLRRFR